MTNHPHKITGLWGARGETGDLVAWGSGFEFDDGQIKCRVSRDNLARRGMAVTE
jgi:hypothetical protein